MRLSIIGLLGTGLVGVLVGCGSDPVEDGSESAGKAGAGKSGASSSGGTGAAGKGGSSPKGGSGGSKAGAAGMTGKGGTGATGGTHATGGTGAKGGTHSMGGTSTLGGTSGTNGVDAGAGGQTGESGAGGVEANAGASTAGAAGADSAGNGGEPSAAGAAGATSCASDVICENACIDPQVRTLDQFALDMPGSVGLSETQRPGESFTVGTAGLLTGIEVAVGPCNGSDTSGDIRLELFDSLGTSLGHVALPQSSLPDTCGGTQLVEPSIGAGYFDLTPLCVSAGVGDAFTFILSVTGNPPATCDTDTWQCTNNGRSCDFDGDCEGFFYVGETNCGGTGCDGAPSSYPGGSEVMQNVDTSALVPSPSFELAFKTFVQ